MASALEIANEFMSGWDKPGGMAAGIRKFFTADSVWVNEGLSKTTGPDEAIQALAAFGVDPETFAQNHKILAIAAVGQKVLMERIDYPVDDAGNTIITIPVMGIIEVKNDKVIAWRDYFDTAGYLASQAKDK